MHSWISFWFKGIVSPRFYLLEHGVLVSKFCEDIRATLDLKKSLKLVFYFIVYLFKVLLQPTLTTGGF
jgi:hypothetical protein